MNTWKILGRWSGTVVSYRPQLGSTFAITMYAKMEEEVRYSTAAFKSMLKRPGDLDDIYEEERKSKEIAISLVRGKTSGSIGYTAHTGPWCS